MVRKTMVAAASLALALFAFGVDDAAAQRPIRFGVIGGANMANLSGDVEGNDSKMGFDVGALLQLPMGEIVTIQPEVHYTQKGASFDTGGEDAEISLDYIEVPVLVRAGVPLAEGFLFDFEVGPSIAFLMSCDQEGDDCGDNTKSMDFGIVAGGGFSWAMGAGDLLVDVRYNLGLSNIVDDDGDESIKNNALQFLIGYAFPM